MNEFTAILKKGLILSGSLAASLFVLQKARGLHPKINQAVGALGFTINQNGG